MNQILELCDKEGFRETEITRLKGDFSERKIYRVSHEGGTCIAVYSSYTVENEAFLSFRDSFERSGIKVPGFIAVSEDKSTYFIEDLGDMTVKTFCDARTHSGDIPSVKKIYHRIIKQLVKIQTDLVKTVDYSKCYQGQVFDRQSMEKDIARFEEYFLKQYQKKYDHAKFLLFKKNILVEADGQSKDFFMYRDFQTRNIMIKNDQLYFIDFQSGRKGSFYYDLASFIYSSNTINYKDMERDIRDEYYNSSKHIFMDHDEFVKILKVFACLRIMQASGNYAFYYFTRNDRTMLTHYERTISRLRSLTEELGYDAFI